MVFASSEVRTLTVLVIEAAPNGGKPSPKKVGCEVIHLFGMVLQPFGAVSIPKTVDV
jgi:hypothetical protein